MFHAASMKIKKRFTAPSLSVAGVFVMVICFSLMAWPTPAAAFCVINLSDQKVFTTAWPKRSSGGPPPFKQWLGVGDTACGNPDEQDSIVAVFVFADEDAVEGCDAEVRGDRTLKLISFVEFDNCVWQGDQPVTKN